MLFTPTGSLLSHATHRAVKSFLSRKHPQLFCLSVLQKSFDNQHIVANNTGKIIGGDGNSKKVIDELAVLNGFSKVSKIHCPVALAEGVVAIQNTAILDKFTIYSRPSIIGNGTSIESESKHIPLNKTIETRAYLPPFREDDFTLYRTLENRLEAYLKHKNESLMRYLSSNPVIVASKKFLMRMLPQKLKEESEPVLDVSAVEQPRVTFHTDANSDESKNEVDIVVLYQGRIVVLEKVLQKFFLLALPPVMLTKPRLPYKLKHNTASTIIYASLVTFGALPLAYRSIKYALDYPAMVELLLASFFGTVAYSIWYSRYGARVRQQLSIERAVGSRIVARDDVALAFLVEGALKNVSQFVLQECNNVGTPLTLEVLNGMGLDPTSIASELKIEQ